MTRAPGVQRGAQHTFSVCLLTPGLHHHAPAGLPSTPKFKPPVEPLYLSQSRRILRATYFLQILNLSRQRRSSLSGSFSAQQTGARFRLWLVDWNHDGRALAFCRFLTRDRPMVQNTYFPVSVVRICRHPKAPHTNQCEEKCYNVRL